MLIGEVQFHCVDCVHYAEHEEEHKMCSALDSAPVTAISPAPLRDSEPETGRKLCGMQRECIC